MTPPIQLHEIGGDDWSIRETGLDLDRLAQTESLFALANGHVGLRGNLDEGEPYGQPGTYLNGLYETRPLPHAEGGYGYPEDGQTIVNVTNGKIIRLLVDDEPFDLRYGELLHHERTLDLRSGLLTRLVEWRSPAGQGIRVRSTRLVSFSQRAIAAIRIEVEPLDGSAQIVVQSELVTNEPTAGESKDPRAAAALAAPLLAEEHSHHGLRSVLVHRTRASQLRMAAGMDHIVDGPGRIDTSAESFKDLARTTITTELTVGETLRVDKLIAYGWSSRRSLPSVRDQVIAALAAAKSTGWDDLVSDQREYLDDFWSHADVELDGDEELQRASRFAVFQGLQAAARAERRGIGAKGLTGPGYDGHAFWDSETFVLPLLTYTVPRAAADALRWRHSTLDLARERAGTLGLKGAAFPWRTIGGQECSGYWPAGTAAFHLAADIAAGVTRYHFATGDDQFERQVGVELLVETARMWASLGHHDENRGGFRIDGVTGPDEYSAIADNNVFTNLMAQRNLRAARTAVELYPDVAERLAVDETELDAWTAAADAMVVPWDEHLKIHPQADNFTRHEVWNFEETSEDEYPLMLHHPYFELYRTQVVKQPDLVLALYLCGDHFTDEEKVRNFAYYEAITVRDSSLSACMQAIVAAEVGHLDLAFDYFAETALLDIHDLAGNTNDGLHLASAAGTWLTLTAGFGGMRDHDGKLSFAPRLPRALDRIAFRMLWHGTRLRVEILPETVRYSVAADADTPSDIIINLYHYGDHFTLTPGATIELHIPPAVEHPAPEQPPGRAPLPRSALTHAAFDDELAGTSSSGTSRDQDSLEFSAPTGSSSSR